VAEREFSRNQLDKLGERLLAQPIADEDLETLSAYQATLRAKTRRQLLIVRTYATARGFDFSDRPEKTLFSIRRKLRESRIRLAQMNDLVGCRLTVPRRGIQKRVCADLTIALPPVQWTDRIASPSSGYRAMHGIRNADGARLEIQVRTSLQSAWANLSEELAARLGDPSIKYGGGPPDVRGILDTLSDRIDALEAAEESLETLATPAILAEMNEADETPATNLMMGLEEGLKGLEMTRADLGAQIDKTLESLT
jgi:hypothetical protein